MRFISKASLGLVVLLASLAFSAAAKADPIVIHTGGFSITNLGNNGSGISGLDTLIGAAASSTHNISGAGSFLALLNPLTFKTGFTGIGSGGHTYDFNFSQDLTINGVTKTMNMVGQIRISQFVDSVQLLSAAPLTFKFNTFSVTVTMLPANIDGLGSGEFCDVLKAKFVVTKDGSPVAEPATLSLLGLGLAGVAAKLRKRRKARLAAETI